MPRFVILEHDWPARHWDFLLEAGDVLRAWRLLAEPAIGKGLPAEPNFDHRLLYLDYEGPVSGGRGTVARWDAGTFEWVEDARSKTFSGRPAAPTSPPPCGGEVAAQRSGAAGEGVELTRAKSVTPSPGGGAPPTSPPHGGGEVGVAGHLPARTIPTEQIEDTPERVVVILHGTKLAGRAELIAHPDGWTVRFNSG